MRKFVLMLSVALVMMGLSGAARADGLMLDTPPATGAPVPMTPGTVSQGQEAMAPAPAALPPPVPAQPPEEPKPAATASGSSWWSRRHLPHFDLFPEAKHYSTLRPCAGPMVAAKPLGYDPQLNLSEADAAAQFRAMDHNHDGRLSFEEFSSLYPRFYPENEDYSQASKRFAALDANGDGFITLKEFIANRNTDYTDNSTMHWTANGARGPDD